MLSAWTLRTCILCYQLAVSRAALTGTDAGDCVSFSINMHIVSRSAFSYTAVCSAVP